MASQSYILFEDMSLSQIATVSGGRLTKAKLDVVQADLPNCLPRKNPDSSISEPDGSELCSA